MRYVLTLSFFWAHALSAQNGFSTANWFTTQNGLSDNTIKCITQDSRGFLWIGTKEGLNRFDGFEFKKYFATKEPANSLANNTISTILEYKKGQLLIATTSGLSVFNTFSNSFENEKIKLPGLKAGSGTLINSLYLDKNGNAWVNHSGELDVLDSNLNYVHRFTNLLWARQLKGVIIRNNNWYSDKQNRLWMFTDTSGIQLIDFSQKKIFNKKNNPHHRLFFNASSIRSAWIDEAANELWYAPWGSGLYRYDLKTNIQQHQDFGFTAIDEYMSVNIMVKTHGGKILCANGFGCFMLDAATLQYQQVNTETPVFAQRDLYLNPLSILRSADNHYWLGTENGLFQLQPEDVVLNRLNFNEGGKKVPWVECNSIFRSTSGSMYITNLSNSFIEVKKDLRSFNAHTIGKKNNTIICLREDKEGQLLVGTSSGLYQFHTGTKKFTQPLWLHPDLYHFRINFIYCDRNDVTWIATRNPFGIYKFSPATGKCEKIKNAVTERFESIGNSSRISFITEDDDYVWMVSRLGGGLIGCKKSSGEWSIYPKKEQYKNLLSKGMIYLHADNKNNLWLCDVYAAGLIQYNYSADGLKLFTRNDGLPSDFIKSVCTDDTKNFWVLTEYGISKFDLEKEKVVFNELFSSGVTNPIELLFFDSLSKTVIAAADNQLIFYPVEKFQPAKKEALHPLIDKVWVNSKLINADVNGQSLKLKPGETNISIDFTVVHYSNADKIKFAYQLSGADNDWKYADASRSAQYAVLTPGSYTFRIKVADENGNWSEPYNSFSFTITPFFWQTAWFRIAFVLAVAGMVFYFFRRRIKNIRHEAEMKKQIAETEMMALRAQMSPHFIFNCLNSIDNLIQDNEKEKATGYLARFAKLIRYILENSKHQLIPVWKDMETLKLYLELETLRFENKFSYHIDISDELLQGDYKIPPLLVQPFVENAIHHGLMKLPDRPAGKLNNPNLLIRAVAQNGEIKFTIEDNGIGRQQAEKIKQLNKTPHQSMGQQITESRVKLFNNAISESIRITDLVNTENEAAGTRVEITLENNKHAL